MFNYVLQEMARPLRRYSIVLKDLPKIKVYHSDNSYFAEVYRTEPRIKAFINKWARSGLISGNYIKDVDALGAAFMHTMYMLWQLYESLEAFHENFEENKHYIHSFCVFVKIYAQGICTFRDLIECFHFVYPHIYSAEWAASFNSTVKMCGSINCINECAAYLRNYHMEDKTYSMANINIIMRDHLGSRYYQFDKRCVSIWRAYVFEYIRGFIEATDPPTYNYQLELSSIAHQRKSLNFTDIGKHLEVDELPAPIKRKSSAVDDDEAGEAGEAN